MKTREPYSPRRQYLRPVDEPHGVVLNWRDHTSWDEFVLRSPDGTVAQRWAWAGIIRSAYGHRVFPLAAVRSGTLIGVLPLTLVRSALFGEAMVSMPYLDTGGICTADEWAESALVRRALDLATEHSARLELRHLTNRNLGLPASLRKVTVIVSLDGGEEAVWARAKSNRRGQVRKARRHGLCAETLGANGLDDFYRVMSVNMRDLGSPMHRRHFFQAIAGAFGTDARFLLVRSGDDVPAAGLLLFHRSSAVLPWSSCLRSARSSGANQLLYWTVIESAIEHGCKEVDLGRSSPGSGTYEAKREWGARQVQLFWHQNPPTTDAPAAIGNSTGLEWATKVWRHLPVPLATRFGALVRGGLSQ
jgi:FemAB-related protein (PEP-CTERM system-associated)